MKFLRWIVAIPVALVAIAFAVANRTPAEISLDPLPFDFAVPVFIVVFAALVAGLAIGAASVWLSGHKWRRLARRRKHRVEVLEREVVRARRPRDDGSGGTGPLPGAVDVR